MSLSCLNYKVHKMLIEYCHLKNNSVSYEMSTHSRNLMIFFSEHHFKEVTVNSCIREQLYFIKVGLHNIVMCSVK